MYGNRFWHKAPFLFIPASVLWVGFEFLCNDLQLVQKLSKKYPRNKNAIKRILHVLCGCIAYLATAFVIFLIKRLTGIALLDYGVN